MKKILAILLIFVLAVGCAGCGNESDVPGETDGNAAVENNEETEGTEESGAEESEGTEPGDKVNPDDLIMGGGDYSSMEGEYDFRFETDASFGLMDTIAEMDYSDISALGPELEDRLKTAADTALNSSFSVFHDYEGIDEDVIDQLSYAIAMENDDTESRYLEAGAYHSQADDRHYQYIMAATENFYEVSAANIASALKTLEEGMGIVISEKTLTEAAEKAFGIATDTEDYYSLMDYGVAEGDGYTESVKVSVDAFATEENVIGFYVSAERERCYE